MCAFEEIKNLITKKRSFVLEAGAGSGKTYTLIQTINYLLQSKTDEFKLRNQKIICITYTNVAKNEINERLENNPMVLVSTIHEFLWDCIKPYNKQLIIELDKLNTIMHQEKPDKFFLGLKDRINIVTYDDTSFRDFENGQLDHDDVITLSKSIFENYKMLSKIVGDKYPYILVDEYQDTATETVEALINYLLKNNEDKILIGFYGDSYQKIYDSGIGSLQSYIDSEDIELVTKEENYRSSENIINLLNLVRKNLVQKMPPDLKKDLGSVRFLNCNNYPPVPKKGIIEYEKSIVPQKNDNYDKVISLLEKDGWNFTEKSSDKILVIANSRVAERGGFGQLYKVFSERFGEGANDALLKRSNNITSFFLGSTDKKTSTERDTGLEHLVLYFQNKDYYKITRFLKRKTNPDIISIHLQVHSDKKVILDKVQGLIELRKSGTVADVYNYAIENTLVVPSKPLVRFIDSMKVNIEDIEVVEVKQKIEKNIKFFNDLMSLQYLEFIQLFKHTQNQTAFSTKHSTKGEQYRNVLVIVDDTSWKQKYNFQNFIDGTDPKNDRLLRSRNLFYVCCSRAKENLAVLSLSEMKEPALSEIKTWFGKNNVLNIGDI